MIICTSICGNYIPKASVLAKSVKNYNSNATFIVFLVEREITSEMLPFLNHFDEVILAKEMGFEDFDKYIFKYDVVEAATAVKGQMFKYLLDKYKLEQNFIYLDPDIKVYNSLEELLSILTEHPIVLTPHMIDHEENDNVDAIMDNEMNSLQHGVFNLGFLAIRRNEISYNFIEWWAKRLALFCYDDMKDKGQFTDQKWIDLAPCFFDVYILRHPGYNVAPWNLSRRAVVQEGDKITVNNCPLYFYHFSGFDSGANETMTKKYVPDSTHIIYRMKNEYIEELNLHGQTILGHILWSYGYYNSGEKITKRARVNYRANGAFSTNPFLKSNSYFEYVLPIDHIERNIYIWGAGDGGKKTKQYYEKLGVTIDKFIDNDLYKTGSQLDGIEVIHPTSIFENGGNNIPFIIIGSSYKNEIIEELIKHGFLQERDFILSRAI
ncbi:glycosyltransferase [Paenibacillus sp. MSJ-34]|uniref:glycosyltransferase n=1 Tax=Paenibacillus sp. MSJ-34 TaxID=2841529 RepID=UPI001C0F7EE7|nr:glycosyltransferase [Paenibacillus sp. MSJ-34]MBU5441000.1 hypothetical protein [Paenibacillus sp. MSJ-34]